MQESAMNPFQILIIGQNEWCSSIWIHSCWNKIRRDLGKDMYTLFISKIRATHYGWHWRSFVIDDVETTVLMETAMDISPHNPGLQHRSYTISIYCLTDKECTPRLEWNCNGSWVGWESVSKRPSRSHPPFQSCFLYLILSVSIALWKTVWVNR